MVSAGCPASAIRFRNWSIKSWIGVELPSNSCISCKSFGFSVRVPLEEADPFERRAKRDDRGHAVDARTGRAVEGVGVVQQSAELGLPNCVGLRVSSLTKGETRAARHVGTRTGNVDAVGPTARYAVVPRADDEAVVVHDHTADLATGARATGGHELRHRKEVLLSRGT